MGRNPFGLGEKKKSEGDNFASNLFYFMREFGFNPLDEEFEIKINDRVLGTIKKKGIPIPLMNRLMQEMEEYYKKEAADMKKAGRK